MANQPSIAKINPQALRLIVEPVFLESIGALPHPEEIVFIARELEAKLPELLKKDLTKGSIDRLHKKFKTEELPKLLGANAAPPAPAKERKA